MKSCTVRVEILKRMPDGSELRMAVRGAMEDPIKSFFIPIMAQPVMFDLLVEVGGEFLGEPCPVATKLVVELIEKGPQVSGLESFPLQHQEMIEQNVHDDTAEAASIRGDPFFCLLNQRMIIGPAVDGPMMFDGVHDVVGENGAKVLRRTTCEITQ